MGGHGGLNILPQKSWNVYGRRNRLKVHEDEEKHRQEQRTREERKEKAEREFRTNILRKRALGDAKDTTASESKHINLFEEEEMTVEDPETKEARESQEKKRGRKEDRTSDAKFDEKFAFAYGVKDSKPWYARPAMRFVEQPLTTKSEKRAANEPKSQKEKKKKQSTSKKKKKLAKELLRELKKSNFKKCDVHDALLRIERDRREKKEKERVRELIKAHKSKTGH